MKISKTSLERSKSVIGVDFVDVRNVMSITDCAQGVSELRPK